MSVNPSWMNVNDSSFDRRMAEHKTMLIKGQDNAKLSTLREVHILGKQGKSSSVAIGVIKFESAERRSNLYRSNNILMSHVLTRSYQTRYYQGKCETYSHKLAFYPKL